MLVRRAHAAHALLLALAAGGCGGSAIDETLAAPDDAGAVDAATDTALDASAEGSADVAVDVAVDVAADTAAEGAADAAPDVAADTTAEAAPAWDGGFGAPIQATNDQWTWVPFSDAFCGNGSTTGLGVQPTTRSDKLLIYLEGGGACWDALTCNILNTASNLNGYGASSFGSGPGSGIFNRADTDNPFRDYSFVYVPYCTGDVHAGDNVASYGTRHVGFANMTAFLKRIAPTFAASSQVVLSGSSAGGFGALWNFVQTQQAFGATHVDLVDDSGPPLRPPYMGISLQQTWNTVWGLTKTMPAQCPTCNTADGLHNLVPTIAAMYPDHRLALISSQQDQVISTFFGIGGLQMQTGLDDFADVVAAPLANFKVFYVTGSHHTWLGENPVGKTTTAGVTLSAFLRREVTGDAAWASVRP